MVSLTDEQCSMFNTNGYAVIENYLSDDEVAELRKECWEIIEAMNPAEHHTEFIVGDKQESNEYFMNSADKIRFFYEEGVRDDKGQLTVDKHKSLNKIGHALHVLSPAFRKTTFSGRIKGIAKALDYVEPVVCQSMCIFKQPGVGGQVVPHQDASYLYAEPLKLMGFWLALEDATEENGCLWFIPNSHKDGLHNNRRFVRSSKAEENKAMIYTAPIPEYKASQFIPVPAKKGTLVLIDGLVVHKSELNTSAKSRHIYAFHMYEGHNAKFSTENWIQPTDVGAFAPLYGTSPLMS